MNGFTTEAGSVTRVADFGAAVVAARAVAPATLTEVSAVASAVARAVTATLRGRVSARLAEIVIVDQPRGRTSGSTPLAGAVVQSVETKETLSEASRATRACASVSAGSELESAGVTS